ncbi:MAG: hypothetical protein R3325_13605, partial [Thermoanaerobaculia bacterium]|nr:hypothetical protein [Thermoanaerobaculia bacterium]
ITDDGPGLAEPVRGVPGGTEGVGLANVRARLAALYGDEASLRLENRPEGGCRARMEVPWRTAPS